MTDIKKFNSVFELRQALIEILTLNPRVLGRFTQGEHNNIDAIWVSPPDPPSGVDGIRCLIERTPTGSSIPGGSRQTIRNEYWSVRLTNFDPESKLIAEAKQRIETCFLLPPSSTLQPQYLAPTGISLEEVAIWLWRPVSIDRRQYRT